MIKPLFSKVPLVAQEFICAIFPLFPYFLNFIIYLENKGIRVEEVCAALATKGAFENKVLFDIQIIIQLNLTAMAGRYAERETIKLTYVPNRSVVHRWNVFNPNR